jgi:hypothetical protein
MKTFDRILTIAISSECIAKARDFALNVVKTVEYSDSNQFDTRKISDDHFISKIGEEAVKTAFENAGCAVSPIDYTIYDGKHKSWAADLTIDGIPLAVKTQKFSSAEKYGLSWTFQASAMRNDPILRNPDGWVCFVECNDYCGFTCRVFPPFQIKYLSFREPRLSHLHGKKKVVYADDFPLLGRK